LRPTSPEVPGELYARIQSHLTRDLGHWAVHTALGTLPPGAYRAALERMERDGLLRTYVAEQDAPARLAFLEQAESRGLLQRLKGAPASGALGYPGEPDFFRNDSKLPEPLRDAVNTHAIQAGHGFYRAHAEYLDRYIHAAHGARSLAELRALGEPKDAYLKEKVLGLEWKDPARERYEKAWRQGVGRPESCNRAYQAVSARQRELSGERPGGSLQLTGKAEVSHQALKLGAEARLDTRGRADVKGEAGMALKGGPVSLQVTRDTSGETKSELEVDLGVATFRQSSDGEVRLSVGVGGSLEGFASLNPRTAEFGGGVLARAGKGGSGAEVEAGFTMKGLQPGRAAAAVDKRHPGLFTPPPE
jgi:hypothetical protein